MEVEKERRGSSWASAGRTPTSTRTSPSSAVWTRRWVMPRLAAGLFGPRRLLDLLRLVRLLEFFGLRNVPLGGELWMMVFEVADGLTEVLVRDQALRLHLLEDFTPAGVPFFLCSNLVERERRGRSALAWCRVLRLEQGAGDLLVTR